jgi:hypothetical protein
MKRGKRVSVFGVRESEECEWKTLLSSSLNTEHRNLNTPKRNVADKGAEHDQGSDCKIS